MRLSKWSIVLAACLAWMPVVALAQASPDEVAAGAGTSDSTYNPEDDDTAIQFDPHKNTIGDPDSPTSLTSGSSEQLTFLSGGADPVTLVYNLINVSLSFLGFISMALLLYAGWKWFSARENAEEADKAKAIITGAVIGLAITLGSLGIAQLLFNVIAQQTEVQTSWFVQPAYAQDADGVTVEGYNSAQLPFDPSHTDQADNIAIDPNDLASPSDEDEGVDLGHADPFTVMVAIVNNLLTLLGMVFMLLMLYAGVTWVAARGNEEGISKAKDTLKRSVIGLTIILGAYALANFVFYLITFQTYGLGLPTGIF